MCKSHVCICAPHLTSLCLVPALFMCCILLHSAMHCHYTLVSPVLCCSMQCCRHSIASAEIYSSQFSLSLLGLSKLENVVQKCVSDLFKTYLCAVQLRVAMHCIVCGSAAVSVHPPATALPRPPLLIHQILETAHRGYRRRNSQTI